MPGLRSRREYLLQSLLTELPYFSDQLHEFYESIAVRLGVNATDFFALHIISDTPNITAGVLAKKTGLTTGAITGVLDRLEGAHLARRGRDPRDRRKVLVRLNAAKAKDVTRLLQSLQRAMEKLHNRHTDRDLALLLRYIRASQEVLGEEVKKMR